MVRINVPLFALLRALLPQGQKLTTAANTMKKTRTPPIDAAHVYAHACTSCTCIPYPFATRSQQRRAADAPLTASSPAASPPVSHRRRRAAALLAQPLPRGARFECGQRRRWTGSPGVCSPETCAFPRGRRARWRAPRSCRAAICRRACC